MKKLYLTPSEIAEKFIEIGIKKTSQSSWKLLLLGILAGAFIAFASQGSNVAIHTIESVGLSKTLAGTQHHLLHISLLLLYQSFVLLTCPLHK
jgi:formate/nitrite transporter FocA (FNT family)